jgi:hypothetical protein
MTRSTKLGAAWHGRGIFRIAFDMRLCGFQYLRDNEFPLR